MDIEKITIFFTNDNEKGGCFVQQGVDKKGTKRKGKSKGDWICQGGGS